MRKVCIWTIFALVLGVWSLGELKKLAARIPDRLSIGERLKRFDRNGDGNVSRDELPPTQADRLLAQADANRDGVIDRDELERTAAQVPIGSDRFGAGLAPSGYYGGGTQSPAFKVGVPAPDFELPLLVTGFGAQNKSAGTITDERVKLSSLRGKKVVCVFLSSYT